MTSSRWRISMVVMLAALASACADEGLEDSTTATPRSTTVFAPSITRMSLTPSTSAARGGALPVFYRVRVGPGDTVAVVAERFRLLPEYATWNNAGAVRDGELIEGAILDIPSANGILHRPQPGETLHDIAARYGVELHAILDHPANGPLAAPSMPAPSVILVPDGRKP